MSKPSDKQKASKTIQHQAADYDSVFSGVVEMLDAARRASARVVNTLMTATYWEIGRRIVEHEQAGEKRAEDDLIPSHSHLFGAWVEGGIGAALLWAWIWFLATKDDAPVLSDFPGCSHGKAIDSSING